MAQTKADIQQILTAVENLQTALTHLQTASSSADETIQVCKQQGWQSSSAAPKFYQDAGRWQTDHDELVRFTTNLIPLLQQAAQDLQRAEAALGGA